jgi:hypothetical protein
MILDFVSLRVTVLSVMVVSLSAEKSAVLIRETTIRFTVLDQYQQWLCWHYYPRG